MDALYLISGFLGLLLVEQTLRVHASETNPPWRFLTIFAFAHTAWAWSHFLNQLFPQPIVPLSLVLACQAISFLSLLFFGVRATVRFPQPFVIRQDLFAILWLLLMAIACAWGWRENQSAGLETVLRLGLALPGAILTALCYLPALRQNAPWNRTTVSLGIVGWLIFALTVGLSAPVNHPLSFGLSNDPPSLFVMNWIGTAALGLVWLSFAIHEWRTAKNNSGDYLPSVWMPPAFLAIAILIGVILARWQEQFYVEKLQQKIENFAFQYRSTFETLYLYTPNGADSLETSLTAKLRDVEPIVGNFLVYTLIKKDGQIVLGPCCGRDCSQSNNARPKRFFLTENDLAVFNSAKAYSTGPFFSGGRFLTAVSPLYDPALGQVVLAVGVETSPEDWRKIQQSARRVPLLASLVMGLLFLATSSRRLRSSLASLFPKFPVELFVVAMVGLILTVTAARIVADRVGLNRTFDLQQISSTLALFLANQVERLSLDLKILAQSLTDQPPTSERFLRALQGTPVSPIFPAWFLLNQDQVVTVIAPSRVTPPTSLQVGDTLDLPSTNQRVLTINSTSHGPALLHGVPGRPGWWVGAILQPTLMLKMALSHLGPSHQDVRATLLDLREHPPKKILASHPSLLSVRQTPSALAPIFFGDRTWAVRTTLPPPRHPLAPEVAVTLLAGMGITGKTMLAALYLKRRQRLLESDVAERTNQLRSREAEARELYERLQRIASNVPGVVFQLKRAPDGTFSFLYLSEAARSFFGHPVPHLLTDASLAFDCLHPHDRPKFMRSLEESARDLAPWREELRLNRPDGPESWFEVSAIPQGVADTSVVWTGVLYEITDRKKNERDLLFRIKFQELLTEMAGSFLFRGTEDIDRALDHLLERVGTFVEADRAYLFTINHQQRTVTNTHEWCAAGVRPEKDSMQSLSFDVIPEVIKTQTAGRQLLIPDVAGMSPSPFKELLQSQEIKSLILLPLIQDNYCFGFAGFDAVRSRRDWRDHEKSLLQVMASMVTQMLLRRKNEQALRESEDQLRRNWEFTRTLLNAIPTPVFYMDREGRFTGCNRSFLEFTGLTVETFAGKTVFDIFDLEVAEDQHAKDLELLRTGERQSYEGFMPDMLGRRREVIFNRDVFCNEKGEITGLVGSFIDISRVRKAEQERREMERQLLHSQKLESLGVLAGGVAHDFNNLLLAINGNLELARLVLHDDSDARRAIDDALLATSRAVDLTRQMLAYSGKGHFIIEDIDINRLISENLAIFKAAVSKNVTFENELTPHLPPIRGDVGQIQQIIMNLITNGSEAVGNKPGSVRISSFLADFSSADLAACRGEVIPEPGTFVVLQVSDTGDGMDTATLNRIFEPFFSTKFTGRGLGMAAVLGILRGHNGGILIDSRPGEGTRVRILFPAVLASPAPATSAKPTIPGGVKLRARVLLADDEAEVRRVCAKMLERLGLEVLPVADGMEAVLAIEAQPFAFDLAMLDLTMPHMDGLSTLAYFSKHFPLLPVILISGYSREEVISGSAAKSCAGFIQKPFRLDLLQAEITRVLNSDSVPH